MTDEKLRQEAEAAANVYADIIVSSGHDMHRTIVLSYVAGYLAHANKAEALAKELQYIVDHEWIARPDYDIAWKWINDFVNGARKAIAEYKGDKA